MATTQATPDSDAIVSEIHIEAPPARVFQALVDPAQVPKWWGQIGIYRCTGFESDLRVGGKWRNSGIDGQGRDFVIGGEYLELDPPRLVVSSWVATWTGDAKTTIRWELEPSGRGTLVRIRHSGFGAHPELSQSYRGWPRMLGWLRSYVEKSETVDDRPAASWG